MALTIYVILCWLLVALLIFEKNLLGKKGQVLLLMFGVFINTHAYLIISDPIKLIHVSTEPTKYIGFVLYRSFVLPLLLTIIVNRFIYYRSVGKILSLLVISIGLFWVIEVVNIKLQLFQYKNWSVFASIFYLTSLLLVELTIMQLVRKRGWT
ncbi:hypothetical protein [Bacillus suaedaesalsae]|uniref:Histidine kinase N-terminal 7TM region domain-containing protein n=1 Tax=Bacillus suaedaesalsae TaxID=2810349 RepID=A0ABS2DCW9_9BACI|nr:hypothetical protein [Bacillus suaedaesalsae]MBM6616293.1 hypothetical protein [Bacillus suaedaesalsae]